MRFFLSGAVGLMVVGGLVFADWWHALPPTTQPQFVGGQRCIDCHQQQADHWRGSHHDLAMQPATPETVLGDFDSATLAYHGIEARMFQRDGRYFVHTEGADGAMSDFEVKWVFGVEPLQQYMVELARDADSPSEELGRVQVLRETWDTEAKRWFYLPPPDVNDRLSPDDGLHWTGAAQRWNTMCADCHSTNLQKAFDDKTGTYHTTFTDIDVNCEACHGPGSIHVQLASSYSLFWDRHHGYGLADLKASAENEIQACAPCHARRQVLDANYAAGQNYYDYFATHIPDPATYFADGQILDEVYEHGSFLQSKMYHRGIRCSDCHDPHTARLKHNGNQVCTSCHQHPSGKYDGPAHHHHRPDSPGASCVACHMPETTYMEVDDRRDHSLRVPRPDLSVEFATPNACTGCHLERVDVPHERREQLGQYRDWVIAARDDPSLREALRGVDQWAAKHVAEWFPQRDWSKQPLEAAELLAHTWLGDSESPSAALELAEHTRYPAILRAAAMQWLAQNPSEEAQRVAEESLEDAAPLVRAEAVRYFENVFPSSMDLNGIPPAHVEQLFAALRPPIRKVAVRLEDPRRIVRTEAARVLNRIPRAVLNRYLAGGQRTLLDQATDELIAGWQTQNDRAAAHAALGSLYEMQGDFESAQRAYRTAMRVEPGATGPRANLAQLLENQLAEIRSPADQEKQQGEIVRLRAEELELLERDGRLAPNIPEVQYRLGLARHLSGDTRNAVAALERAYALDSDNSRYVLMLALVHERLEQYAEAKRYANELLKLVPDDPGYRSLLDRIERRSPGP